ncbi:DUF4860 domain-containing protein [Cellulosilyticum sp. I15G10I2]|uniref:DUF4860 domain-containing protein n=1 Tax=Cellulosilyticum sp. I15G10I2 TaxID=1892843 RepID=UPI0009F32D61|nr:DUF4860 domain-containing protein [Cellulosilyticum sp. I15G10I2]
MKAASNILFVLGLLLVFVVSAFMLVLIGADAYKKITRDMESNFERRTPISYIAAKIRGADQKGQVSIVPKEGYDVLVLGQTIEGVDYETWIYAYEGQLYEAFIEKGTPIALADGMGMIEIQGLKMEELQERLLRFETMDHLGKTLELVISLRSELKEVSVTSKGGS